MDYSKVKIRPLFNREIEKAAEKIRVNFWGDKIPIDIENILEHGLKISIIPSPGLKERGNTDSFITSDWQNVYVDNDRYSNDRYYPRIRFSLAHELGHYVLHQELFESLGIKALEDYYRFFEEFPQEQYGFLETQAHKFASNLLMPRNLLRPYKEKYLVRARTKLVAKNIKGIEDIDLIPVIVDDIADIFNVSSSAMEVALKS